MSPSTPPSGLVVLGEALAALVPDHHQPVRRSVALQRFSVGAEINAAVAVSRLGLSSAVISRVGDDLIGRAIIDDLRHEGVDTSRIEIDPEGFTGLLIRENPAPGLAEVAYYRQGSAATKLREDMVDRKVLGSFQMALVSGITPALGQSAAATTMAFLTQAKAAGLRVCVDMNYRAKLWSREQAAPVLHEMAEMADIVVGGELEWELAFGINSLDQAPLPSSTLAVMTRGDAAVTSSQNGQLSEHQTIATRMVDAVGAGDAFTGGMLAGLMAGLEPDRAIAQGIYCGSRVVSKLGDWTGLPFGTGGVVEIPTDQGQVRR